MSRSITLAVIPGDGIGPEVVTEGLKVLNAVAGPGVFAPTMYDLGASRWQRTGEVLPDSVLTELAAADVILLGAVGAAPGATDVPSGLLERGLLLKLRFAFDHYVNLRPSRLYPGVPTPLSEQVIAGNEVDFVVVVVVVVVTRVVDVVLATHRMTICTSSGSNSSTRMRPTYGPAPGVGPHWYGTRPRTVDWFCRSAPIVTSGALPR